MESTDPNFRPSSNLEFSHRYFTFQLALKSKKESKGAARHEIEKLVRAAAVDGEIDSKDLSELAEETGLAKDELRKVKFPNF